MNEKSYIQGSRASWLSMLSLCIRNLGYEDGPKSQWAWISEREETIQVLRRICEKFGDNDWYESLHLADIVDKHLGRHLHSSYGD